MNEYEIEIFQPFKYITIYRTSGSDIRILVNDYRINKLEIGKVYPDYHYCFYVIEDIKDKFIKELLEKLITFKTNIDPIDLHDEYMIIKGYKVFYDDWKNNLEICYGNNAKGILNKVGYYE